MGQIRIDVDGFSLKSTYKCYKQVYVYRLRGETEPAFTREWPTWSSPTTAKSTIRFDYAIPAGATVTGAKLYATLGSPLNGADMSTINGERVGTADSVVVDVALTDGASCVEVPVAFRCKRVEHFLDGTHDYPVFEKTTAGDEGKYEYSCYWHAYNHVSSLAYSDVYLLIDYEGEDEPGDDTGEDEPGDDSPGETGGFTATNLQVVEADSFRLVSRYTCTTTLVENYINSGYTTDDGNIAWMQISENCSTTTTTPTRVSQTVAFSYTVPENSVIKSARIVATVGSPKYAADILTINGEHVDNGTDVSVDVVLPDGSNTIEVPFVFRTVAASHDHRSDGKLVDSSWTHSPDYAAARRTRVYGYDHSSSVSFDNVQLVIEYEEQGAQGWELDEWEIEAGDTVTLSLTEGADEHDRIVQVTFGDVVSEYTIPAGETSVDIPVPIEWLDEIPTTVSGVALVTVTTHNVDTGEVVAQSRDNLTIRCPDDAEPGWMFYYTQPLYTVDGVTYPSPLQNVYVQGKCGVRAVWTDVEAKYGATIVSQHVNVGRYTDEAYNAPGSSIESGLLTEAGRIPVTLTIVDSRGLTRTGTQYINVIAYEPPIVSDLKVWRVNARGEEDATGSYAMCSFTPIGSGVAELRNRLTATLKVDGLTETFDPEHGTLHTCWLLPSNPHALEDAATYAVELTLSDLWESVTIKVGTILPATGTTVVIRPTRRRKRGLIIGDYDTVTEADWTMTALSFPEPDDQQNLVAVPGRAKGPLDMSTALTGGIPTYGSRSLTARFELSAGTRAERNDHISRMINELDGLRWQIVLPDDPDRYVEGRVRVKTEYSDLAHAAVSVTAVCEPWRYNKLETEIAYEVSDEEREGVLPNLGRRVLTPRIRVEGIVTLTCDGNTWTLGSGEYILPELLLRPGNNPVAYRGGGLITFTYREAVL